MPQKKKLVLIRGLPGSGKSTLAKKLDKEYKYRLEDLSCHIETDSFWINPWTPDNWYRWQVEFIQDAHNACYSHMVKLFMVLDFEQVIISNTFTTFREMKRYLEFCLKYDIELEVLEPDNPDRFDIQKCFERNIHNVPLETIEKMARHWQDLPTGKWTHSMMKEFL